MKSSIVIPAFNAADYIVETITSLLQENGDDYEIILVDDGSTDNTKEVVAPYLNDRVRYIYQANSGGPAKPRNTGIANSTGELIFLFDADDIALPDKMQASVALLDQHPDAGMLFTNFNVVDQGGTITEHKYLDKYITLNKLLEYELGDNAFKLNPVDCFAGLFKSNFIGTPGVAIRRSVFEKLGLFDESMRNLDDRDMWIRVAKEYPLIYVNTPYFNYRNNPLGISKQRLQDQAWERIQIADKFIGREGNSKTIEQLLKEFKAVNYLKIAYINADELFDSSLARKTFFKSFMLKPSFKAFKGFVKALSGDKALSLYKRYIR